MYMVQTKKPRNHKAKSQLQTNDPPHWPARPRTSPWPWHNGTEIFDVRVRGWSADPIVLTGLAMTGLKCPWKSHGNSLADGAIMLYKNVKK